MTPVLVALLGIVAVGGSAVVGARTALWYRDQKKPVCSATGGDHLWGSWESSDLLDKIALVPGQKRECVSCGERQVRRVLAA